MSAGVGLAQFFVFIMMKDGIIEVDIAPMLYGVVLEVVPTGQLEGGVAGITTPFAVEQIGITVVIGVPPAG